MAKNQDEKKQDRKKGELHSRGKDEALHRELGSFRGEPKGNRRALRFEPHFAPEVTPVGSPGAVDGGVSALPNAALGMSDSGMSDSGMSDSGTGAALAEELATALDEPGGSVMTEPHPPLNPDAQTDFRTGAPPGGVFHGGPVAPNEDRPPAAAPLSEGAPPDFDAVPRGVGEEPRGYRPRAAAVRAVAARVRTGGAFDAMADSMAAGTRNRWSGLAPEGEEAASMTPRERLAHAIMHAWNAGSVAEDSRAFDTARAAQEEFGLKGASLAHATPAARRYAHLDGDIPALREFLRGQYEHTQAALAAQGKDSVPVYRGMGWGPGEADRHPELVRRAAAEGGPVRHEAVPVTPAPLSSHAMGQMPAQGFARGAHGMLYQAQAPRASVLSTHETGMGTAHENEAVLLGHPFAARAVAAPSRHFAVGTPVPLAETLGLSEWEVLALEEQIETDRNACVALSLDCQTPVWVQLDLSDERIEEICIGLATPGQFSTQQAAILKALHSAGGTGNYHALRAAAGGNVAGHLRPLVQQGLVQPVGNKTGSPQHALTPAGHAAMQQTGGAVAPPPSAPAAPAPAPVTTPHAAPAAPGPGGTGAFHTGGTHRVQGGTATSPSQAYHYAPGATPPGMLNSTVMGNVKDQSGASLHPHTELDLMDLHDQTAGNKAALAQPSPLPNVAALVQHGYASQTGGTNHITAAGINALRQAGGNVASDQATWTHTASGQAATPPFGKLQAQPTTESASAQRAFTHADMAQHVVNTLVGHYAAVGPKAASAAIQADPEFQTAIAGLKQACIALNSQKANAANPKYAKGGVVNPTMVARYQAELDHYREARDVLADAALRGVGVDVVRPVGTAPAHAAQTQASGPPSAAAMVANANAAIAQTMQATPAAPPPTVVGTGAGGWKHTTTATPAAPAASAQNSAHLQAYNAFNSDTRDVLDSLEDLESQGITPTLSRVHSNLDPGTAISSTSQTGAILRTMVNRGLANLSPPGSIHFNLSPTGVQMMQAVRASLGLPARTTGPLATAPAGAPATPAGATAPTPPGAPAAGLSAIQHALLQAIHSAVSANGGPVSPTTARAQLPPGHPFVSSASSLGHGLTALKNQGYIHFVLQGAGPSGGYDLTAAGHALLGSTPAAQAAPAPSAPPAAAQPQPATPPAGSPPLTPQEQAVLNVLTSSRQEMHFNSIRTHRTLKSGGTTFPTAVLTTALQGLMQKGLVATHAAKSAGKTFGQSYFMPVGGAGAGSTASVTPHPTQSPTAAQPAPVTGMRGVHNPPPPGGLQIGPNSSYIQMGVGANQGLPGAPVLTVPIRAGKSTLPLTLSKGGPAPGSQPYLNAAKFPDRNHAADFGMTYQGPTGNIVKVWHGSSTHSLKGATVSGLRPGNTNAYGFGLYTGAGNMVSGYAAGCNYLMELHTGRCVHVNNVGALVAQYQKDQPVAAQKLAFDNSRLEAAAALHAGYSSIMTTYGNAHPSYIVLDPSRCRIESVTDNQGTPLPIPALGNQTTAPPSLPITARATSKSHGTGVGGPSFYMGPTTAWTGTPDLASVKDPTLTARNAAVGADPNLPLSDNGYNAIVRIGQSVQGKKMSKAQIDAGRSVARAIRPVRAVGSAQSLLTILSSDAMISAAELNRQIAAAKSDPSPEGQALHARLSAIPQQNNPVDKQLGLDDAVFLNYGSPQAFSAYGPISLVYKPEVLNTPGAKVNVHSVNSYNNNGAAPLNAKAWADNEIDGAEASEVFAYQLAAGFPVTQADGKMHPPMNGPLASPTDYLGQHTLAARESAEVHVPTSVSHHHISHILVPHGTQVTLGGAGAVHPHFNLTPGLYDKVKNIHGQDRDAATWQRLNNGTDGQTALIDGQHLKLRNVAQPGGLPKWQFEVPQVAAKSVSLAQHLHTVLAHKGLDVTVVETQDGAHARPHATATSVYAPGGVTPTTSFQRHGHGSTYEAICWGSV